MQLRTLSRNGAPLSLLLSTASALLLSKRGWVPPRDRCLAVRPSLVFSFLGPSDRRVESTHRLHGGDEFGDINADNRTLPCTALDFQAEIRAVQHAQPLAYIAKPNSLDIYVRHFLLRNAYAIVFNLNPQTSVAIRGAQLDSAPIDFRRQPVLQTILHDRLQQHAWDERLQRLFIDLFHNFQVVAPKPRHFDVQVIVDELQLFAQRHKRFVLAQQPPQNVAQLQHHAARRVRIKPNQRRHRVQRVEQKVWIDLARKRVHARLEQQLLVPLEIHFDARVVPNLQRRSHGHQRRQHTKYQPPIPRRMDEDQPFRLGRHRDRHAAKLQHNASQQRQQFPRHLPVPNESHHVPRNVQKRERTKVPQLFFVWDRLAHQAAQQPRGSRRRHGQPFVCRQRRNRDNRAANRPHHAPAQQTHEKGALQRKVSEPVRQSHQAQRNAHNQRRRHKQHQFQFLVRIAFLREKHTPKGVPPRQQRRKRRRHTHLQQQRKQQVLNRGQGVHAIP